MKLCKKKMTIIPVHTQKNIQTLLLNATQVDVARAPQILKKHSNKQSSQSTYIILSITKQNKNTVITLFTKLYFSNYMNHCFFGAHLTNFNNNNSLSLTKITVL